MVCLNFCLPAVGLKVSLDHVRCRWGLEVRKKIIIHINRDVPKLQLCGMATSVRNFDGLNSKETKYHERPSFEIVIFMQAIETAT